MKFTWRHIKRFLFENDYYKDSILTRRQRRLEFYEFRRKFKCICKQTNLEEKDYKWFNYVETDDKNYSVLGKLKFYYSEIDLPMDDFIANQHKLVCLYRIGGITIGLLIGNNFIYYNEFYELWCLWRDAPFWKDYAVWKKLNNLSNDF